MPNHNITLITDSTCDIPDELMVRYDIGMVPATVIWGDEVLRDRIDISATQFYRRLETDPHFPKTAHATPEEFRLAYEAAHAHGAAGGGNHHRKQCNERHLQRGLVGGGASQLPRDGCGRQGSDHEPWLAGAGCAHGAARGGPMRLR